MDLIKGKIAAIVNQKTMVINKGKNHGVTVGMLFNIKLNIPDISDPDNENMKLTGVYYTKGKLKVTSVYENMSFVSLQPNFTKFNVVATQMLFTETYPNVEDEFLVSSEDWIIRVRDEVIQVEKEKKEDI